MVFRENRSEEELDDLDVELGFKEDEEDDAPVVMHGSVGGGAVVDMLGDVIAV